MAREEKKKQQELEEARKAGLAQPAVDEEGKEINPHIPQFMSATPWYMNEDRPTLRHQRNWNQADRKSTRLNSSHRSLSRMPSSA